MESTIQSILGRGTVIPASPLAIDRHRKLDERRQRALWRYYSAAGAGGIAVGVHTTQFAIRRPEFGLHRPLMELARDEFDALDQERSEPLVRIAGVCGRTDQALGEAVLARECGFHAGLLSLSAFGDQSDATRLEHCRAVAQVLPVVGFYLQPAVGGCRLGYEFWRRFAEIENVVAIKIAAFNRYQTLDVIRAVAHSGRDEIALYTGNDDNIVLDLLTPYRFQVGGQIVERRMVGGLLGHWAVWTRRAVELLEKCHDVVHSALAVPDELLAHSIEVTDANAALFDTVGDFAGCVPGIHEVLRRQGLLEGIWCLDDEERLSPGQKEEIDRVYQAYPHLNDDAFVEEHRDQWLGDTSG